MTLQDRVRAFDGSPTLRVRKCRHKHQLQHTGAVFYQSAGLLQCVRCYGWQEIRKPVA